MTILTTTADLISKSCSERLVNIVWATAQSQIPVSFKALANLLYEKKYCSRNWRLKEDFEYIKGFSHITDTQTPFFDWNFGSQHQ
jgi:hypothetical protein